MTKLSTANRPRYRPLDDEPDNVEFVCMPCDKPPLSKWNRSMFIG